MERNKKCLHTAYCLFCYLRQIGGIILGLNFAHCFTCLFIGAALKCPSQGLRDDFCWELHIPQAKSPHLLTVCDAQTFQMVLSSRCIWLCTASFYLS
ncbi:hypothetical protein Y1Q_0006302 [Alligator mississippiensis]|uniref:Uncharacterized protein n=1 Tax=Alligator mississippiensis TaxID=8496 RepID=A0A151NYK2_ALLMI|nr:hypothetical protein Y1Q_0006302 [Alligator mississippiensis]